jgi:hypothetical protein
MAERKRKLLDQVRDVIRLKHYSIRTEETYVMWISQFIRFYKNRHPSGSHPSFLHTFFDKTQYLLNNAIPSLWRYIAHCDIIAILDSLNKRASL